MAHFAFFSGLAIAWFLVANSVLSVMSWSGEIDPSFSLASDSRGKIAIVTGASSACCSLLQFTCRCNHIEFP